jgi:sigma-B regulation protein RsbU (phosphoserine phosphatase)
MAQTILFNKVPLLKDLPRKELDYLAANLQVVNLVPEEVLFCECDPGESLYIILEGQVEVVLALGTSDERRLAVFGPGEFIGEMSLLIPGRARTASVRAVTRTRLWMMTRFDFDGLLTRQPKLAYTMVQTLTKRLDATTMLSFHDLQEKNRKLQQAYDELKAAQLQIIEKERLEHELQVAAEIQVSILPQDLPMVPGYTFGAVMYPARMVGGDFYDVFTLDNNQVGLVVGDVSDKGIPSAIFMARTHALIMSEVQHGGTPGEILRRVNTHLIKLGQSDQFVTVLLGILDPALGRIDYARAGHELPLLFDADGHVEVIPHVTGQAIGMFDDILLDENSISLPAGGTFLLFTDGLTDCRNPQGQVFGHARVRDLLPGMAGQDGQKVCNALKEALARYQSGAAQDDDVTMVAVHSTGQEQGQKLTVLED